MSNFQLGAKSQIELVGVHPKLVAIVKRAIEISTTDFVVYDGIRSVEEQKLYVAQGVSKTMHSKHLLGHAVDLVPFIAGKPRWSWPQIYQIAAAMLIATREFNGQTVYWGVVWDRPLMQLGKGITDITELPQVLQREGLDYNQRHPGKDFPDGPHFEIKV